MIKVQIVYKSGAVVNLKVRKFDVEKSATGRIKELSWTSGRRRVAYMSADDIAAVIYK